jgi:hypothetical protein
LATEYYLLKQNGQSTADVKYELYCALNSINRLDLAAEPFWGQSSELDGFILRDDIPNDSVFLSLLPITKLANTKSHINPACIYLQNINFIRCIFHTINNLNFIDKHSGLNLQNKHEIICLLSVSIILVQLKQAL